MVDLNQTLTVFLNEHPSSGWKSKTQLSAACKTQMRKQNFGYEIFKLANLVQNIALSNKWQGFIKKKVIIEDT